MTTTTQENSFVNFARFDKNKLSFVKGKPFTKEIEDKEGKKSKVTFFYPNIMYTYSDGVARPLIVEGPRCYTKGGIIEASFGGRKTTQVKIFMRRSEPEAMQFRSVLNDVYEAFATFVFNNKKDFNEETFIITVPGAGKFVKQIVKQKFKDFVYDEPNEDGTPSTYDPSMYVKLIDVGSGNYRRKSVFKAPFRDPKDPRKVFTYEWTDLMGADFDIIPAVDLSGGCIGNGKISIQTKLPSCICLNVSPPGDDVGQKETLKAFAEKGDDYLNEEFEKAMKLFKIRNGSAPSTAATAAVASSSSTPSAQVVTGTLDTGATVSAATMGTLDLSSILASAPTSTIQRLE